MSEGTFLTLRHTYSKKTYAGPGKTSQTTTTTTTTNNNNTTINNNNKQYQTKTKTNKQTTRLPRFFFFFFLQNDPWYATTTKHSFPSYRKKRRREEEQTMTNKHHIWNYRHKNKELQQRNPRVDSEGIRGFSRTSLWLKILFQWEMLDTVDKSVTLFLILFFNKFILLPVNMCKITRSVANSVDPNQTPRSAASDLGLNCLLKAIYPNT